MGWAGLGAGAGMLLINNLSEHYGSGAGLRAEKREEEMHDRLEFEKMGIQARVEGAKAAGLHPLVGVGAQLSGGGSFQQITGNEGQFVPGMGGDPPPPVEKESPDENIQRYNAARARLAEAQASQAELDLAASRVRLASQPGQPKPLTTDVRNQGTSDVVIKPAEITAGAGGIEAGVRPSLSTFEFPGLGTVMMPSEKMNENLEDLEAAKYAAILGSNMALLDQSVLPRMGQAARDRILEWLYGYDVANSRREVDRLLRRYPAPPKKGRRWSGRVE